MLFPELLVAFLESVGRRLKFQHISIIELAKYGLFKMIKAAVADRNSLIIDMKYIRKFKRMHRGGLGGEISPSSKTNHGMYRKTSAHAG